MFFIDKYKEIKQNENLLLIIKLVITWTINYSFISKANLYHHNVCPSYFRLLKMVLGFYCKHVRVSDHRSRPRLLKELLVLPGFHLLGPGVVLLLISTSCRGLDWLYFGPWHRTYCVSLRLVAPCGWSARTHRRHQTLPYSHLQ